MRKDEELVPHRVAVAQRFEAWMAQQRQQGREFSPEQVRWLELIRDHAATSLGIDDFDYAPFAEEGGLGKAVQVFGEELRGLLDELNEVLAA